MRLTEPITVLDAEAEISLVAGTRPDADRTDPASETSENVRDAADIMDKPSRREERFPTAELQCTVAGVATGNINEPDCEEDPVANNDAE